MVTRPLEFATCVNEAADATAVIERADLRPGDAICVPTNGRRFALVTIVDVSKQAVEFGATVWPPIPS